MNFFRADCQEPERYDQTFGICDDQDGSPAYTDSLDPTKWGATVVNQRELGLTFSAIDKCLLQDHELLGVGRCEGMLHSIEHLYFVELKDQKENWISNAVGQLESTIRLFLMHHDPTPFRHRKAFACNRARPRFHAIDNEENLPFIQRYGFRLDVQAEIIVI